jgi:ribosome modulation factor
VQHQAAGLKRSLCPLQQRQQQVRWHDGGVRGARGGQR